MIPTQRLSLLVDATEFWSSLEQDILASKESVWLQTLSFEGDAVGQRLADLLLGLHGVEVRLLVDGFTKWVINDRSLLAPWNLSDASLWREVAATRAMVETLTANGVQVQFTNPFGLLFRNLMSRNHKKGIIIDRKIAYIGGINFAEHNFAWHDLMVRVEDTEVAEALAEDFSATWAGRTQRSEHHFRDMTLYGLDGHTNHHGFAAMEALIQRAQHSILVQSPYVTFPVCDYLREASQRGIAVTIITPRHNNLVFLQQYIIGEAHRSGFRLLFYPQRMTHVKAMLIDESHLILGSSNFDCFSYYFFQDTLLCLTNTVLIAEFSQRIIAEDVPVSLVAGPPSPLTRHTYPFFRLLLLLLIRLFDGVRHKPPWTKQYLAELPLGD